MLNLKNSFLILFAMLILIAIPISFAADVDNNATLAEVGIDDSSDIVQAVDESDQLAEDGGEGFIDFENTNIEIDEGDTATINANVYWYEDMQCWDEVSFEYSYVDDTGATKTGTVKNMEYMYADWGFSLTISGLKASGSPYVVTFTPVEDDDYETFCIYSGGMDPNKPTSVSIIVNGLEPTYDYETSVEPSSISYYEASPSQTVTVKADFESLGELEEGDANWLVYINGDTSGIELDTDATVKSFEFDLSTIIDNLNEGENTLIFHPDQYMLERLGNLATFNYNPLIINYVPIPVTYFGVIYVSDSGSDDNDGSENAPVKTIQKAIKLASNERNTEHKIIIHEGTYAEHDLGINSPLDISADGNVVIDAQQLGRIFDIKADTNISGITFKNGKSDNGGAISIKDAKVTIDNSLFEDNEASSYGSAIYWDANNGVLTNTKFTNNTARNGVVSLGVFSWGSGTTGSNTLVENCTFDDNHNGVVYGNCIGLDVTGNDVTIKNTNFTNNKGEYGSEHGALYIKGDNAIVDNCLFENNTMGMAAAIQLDGEGTKVSNSKFINNTVSGYPARSGAIEIQNSAEITNNIFISNGGEDCNQGGAIDVVYAEYGGEITISNNQFINNSAKNGAGVYVDGGAEDYYEFDSVNIADNVFDGNIAINGAGIYTATSFNEISIDNNEFKNLNAESGVCIYNDGVPVSVSGNTVENCTSADGNYIYDENGDIEGDFPVNPVIEISTNNPHFGENATITIKLPVDATSNITVTVDNNVVVDSKLKDGVLTLNISGLAVGTHNVTVTYAGDTSYVKLTNETSFTVSKAEIEFDDNVLDISIPAGDNSPSFTINLPIDATGTLNVTVDGKSYIANVTNGTATVNVPNLSYGTHNVIVSYSGDSNYNGITKNTKVDVPKPIINAKDVTMLYSSSKVYKVRVTAGGNAVANQYVTFKFNGKNVKVLTDANGYAAYKIPTLKPKKAKYTITVTFNGITKTNKVKVNSIIKAANKKVKKSAKKLKIKVTLKKVDGKVLKGKTLKLKLKGKTIKAKTNKKGIAKFTIKKNILKKLKAGKKYKFTVTYGKDKVTKKLTVKK